MRSVVLLFVVLLVPVVHPRAASAVCRNTNCVCGDQIGVEVLEIVTGAPETGRILQLHGATGTDEVGAVVPFERAAISDAVGSKLVAGVMTLEPATRFELARIDSDDNTVCDREQSPFKLPVSDTAELASPETCWQLMLARGIPEPPCNDTGCGCTSADHAGVALALAAFSRRRRRVAPEASCVT